MSLFSLILTAIALAMDAFAVSISKGLALKKVKLKDCMIVGLWFGIFQALMPLIGYSVIKLFSKIGLEKYITTFDHWVAFILLSLLGIMMIKESFGKEDGEENSSLGFKVMMVSAIATSIDALAAGITFAALNVNIATAVSIIGLITLIFSTFGVKLGEMVGVLFKSKAKFIGGCILILIGLKILLEHLGVITLPF